MAELLSVRERVVALLGEVSDVEDAVVRAERRYEGKSYAVAYVDLADDVVGRAQYLHEFQERILGDDFFGTSGDLRWNKYLFIVAGPKSRSHGDFEAAKAAIESDKEYARKRVVSEMELEALLSAASHFTPSTTDKDFNVVSEWEKRLAVADLDELLDRPVRKEVLERIGLRTAKRVPVNDKSLVLSPADSLLAKSWLASISIDRFRPVHDGRSYKFGQVTLILGANGTGKTSLLEAIEFFYCGHNRRPTGSTTPKISGHLTGSREPVPAPTESARIKARCFSWYNRDERLAKSILGAFTRYNFLDTDAAFRLSTEIEPTEIPNDLSRLLVGSDAAAIWDYLSKISPEVETAYERAILTTDDVQQKLDSARKELSELQSRPSNAKALTEAFRASLGSLRWRAAVASDPLVTAHEVKPLQTLLGHLQALLAAGTDAVSIDAIARRGQEIAVALSEAGPLETRRIEHASEVKRIAERAVASERAAQTLERWLPYVLGGFSAARARLVAAKAVADLALGRLGLHATGGVPEVPDSYAATPLNVALEGAVANVEVAKTQVSNLEKLSATFSTAAAARAQAAYQLQSAARALFESGHPPDDCPICHAKYVPSELSALVAGITSVFENKDEANQVAAQLSAARQDLDRLQGWVSYFQSLQRIAIAIGLAPHAACGAIPQHLVRLRSESAIASSELVQANKDWDQLAGSGLTTSQHDLLRQDVALILRSPDSELEVAKIKDEQGRLLGDATALRELERAQLALLSDITAQLAEMSARLSTGTWQTRAFATGGMQALLTMQQEVTSLQDRSRSLLELIDIDGAASLADANLAVVAATRIHGEATQAASNESSASVTISSLTERIDQLDRQLSRASDKAKNYLAARDALASLATECSLERATQKSLETIGSQINEIFGRIHSPNEYEYVGRGNVLLQTSTTKHARTLEQVSTGQRAAFALSVFLAMNRSAAVAPPVLLIDDPIAHIDDLNALSFLDYLRDLAVNSNRQIFFATADNRIAALFERKFSFLAESFQTIRLARTSVSP
jgi:chromosome segregation protein